MFAAYKLTIVAAGVDEVEVSEDALDWTDREGLEVARCSPEAAAAFNAGAECNFRFDGDMIVLSGVT